MQRSDEHPSLPIYASHFTIGHGAHHDLKLGESSTSSPVCRLKQVKQGALLEIHDFRVVRVNGKALDKAAKITLNGGDDIVFRSPVRHVYIFEQLKQEKSSTPTLISACSCIQQGQHSHFKDITDHLSSKRPKVSTIYFSKGRSSLMPNGTSAGPILPNLCKTMEERSQFNSEENIPFGQCQLQIEDLKNATVDPSAISESFDSFQYYLRYYDHQIKPGMIFNISLGLHNVQAETTIEKTKQFSLLLADTVLVNEKGHKILTACSKAVKDIAYSYNEDEEDALVVKVESKVTEVLPSKATLRSDNQEMSKEELCRQHQAELARQKNEETARRLAGGGSGSGDGRGPTRVSNELIAYKNFNDVPYARELVIQADQKNEAVLLPIYSSMVPFYVSTVKSVTSHQDNRTCTISIFFNVPGMPFSNDSKLNSQGAIYLKEITFRSKDPRYSSEVVQQIKTLRRQIAPRESERAERATLVTQEKLQLANNRMKMMRLSEYYSYTQGGAHVGGKQCCHAKP